MAAQVLGISGSPIPDSNTDRAVQLVCESTGLDSEFIKLSRLSLSPCRACLGCKDSNDCVVDDDGRVLARKFRDAKAFVIGGYTPYSSLDAMTKTFMERMYCLRHQAGMNRGKIGACVITTACRPGVEGLPPAADIAVSQIQFWMMEEGMHLLDSMILLGNVPCVRCGYGDQCAMSGIKMLEGSDATVAGVGIRRFEDHGALVEQARSLGQKIRRAVLDVETVN